MPAYTSARYAFEGTETTETSVVRAGGATDPAGQIQSRKIVTTANAQWLRPFKAEPYAVWNATTGASITATIYGMANALPNNDELWAEFEYLGSSSSTLGSIITTTKANVLATGAAVASDASTWNNLPSVVTFDSALALNVTLSNGNLTVTHNTTTDAGAIVAAPNRTGKFYFEITLVTTGVDVVGLTVFGTSYANLINGTNNTISFQPSNGTIVIFGVTTSANIGIAAAGSVIGIAVDLDAGLVWMRRAAGTWNNSGTANPATGVGGLSFPINDFVPVLGMAAGAGSESATANFGATAYANAAPSGFGNWSYNFVPFKLTATLTPGQAGYIHARVRVGKASLYYIDPQVLLG